MKHLISYKIFEAPMYGSLQYSNVEELKLELEDALIDLKDDGFNAEVKFSKDYKMHLFITFLDYQSKTATWNEIKDYVDRVNIISDKFDPVGIYYKVMQPDGRVFNRNDRDFVGWDDLQSVVDELEKSVMPKVPTPLTTYYPGLEKKLCFFAIEYIEKV